MVHPEQVATLLTKDEAAALRARADANGRSLSGEVRFAIRRHLENVNPATVATEPGSGSRGAARNARSA